MNTILLDNYYVLDYIKKEINDSKCGIKTVKYADYHHNTKYKNVPLICSNGLLAIKELHNKGLKNYSLDLLKQKSDIESHVNGDDAISLSMVGLDDLYPDEFEYNPHSPFMVDILISSFINASRNSTHYGNEFLSYESIKPDKLKSIDIRLLKLISLIDKNTYSNIISLSDIIDNYNYLIDISLAIKKCKLDIPLREMSYQDDSLLDIDKLSSLPKITLTKL